MSAGRSFGALDETPALLREGYPFILDRCRRFGRDAFDTRLMLRTTTCMTGRDAAEVFYGGQRMQRAGALPLRGRQTLTGEGAVQTLDGDAHRERKAVLMSLMSGQAIDELARLTRLQWRHALARRPRGERVVLFDEAERVLCRAACEWAGVPLPEEDVARRTADLDKLFRGAAAVGPFHWRARAARNRCERWISGLIEQQRRASAERGADRPAEDETRPLHVLAQHRDHQGRRLTPRIAAVELINLLRPCVALSVYAAFAAHALHRYPESRPAAGSATDRERFVHEVRRYYPFFPFAAAVVSQPFEFAGHPLPAGRRVLLDLYGTCRDGRLWSQPERFRPERFDDGDIDPFALIAQGGGEHYRDHRCAGEWATIRVLESTVEFLLEEASYRVPEQNLHIDMSRIPTTPASGFVIAVDRTPD